MGHGHLTDAMLAAPMLTARRTARAGIGASMAQLRGPLPLGVEVQGADDLKAAKTVFKDNWERLLAAGSVKP